MTHQTILVPKIPEYEYEYCDPDEETDDGYEICDRVDEDDPTQVIVATVHPRRLQTVTMKLFQRRTCQKNSAKDLLAGVYDGNDVVVIQGIKGEPIRLNKEADVSRASATSVGEGNEEKGKRERSVGQRMTKKRLSLTRKERPRVLNQVVMERRRRAARRKVFGNRPR